jgi:hypothetical protein
MEREREKGGIHNWICFCGGATAVGGLRRCFRRGAGNCTRGRVRSPEVAKVRHFLLGIGRYYSVLVGKMVGARAFFPPMLATVRQPVPIEISMSAGSACGTRSRRLGAGPVRS